GMLRGCNIFKPTVTFARIGESCGEEACSSTENLVNRTGTMRLGPQQHKRSGTLPRGTGVAVDVIPAAPPIPPPSAPAAAPSDPPASSSGYNNISSAATRLPTPATMAMPLVTGLSRSSAASNSRVRSNDSGGSCGCALTGSLLPPCPPSCPPLYHV